MDAAVLLSVQVALPAKLSTAAGELRTAMRKCEVTGPVALGLRALAGDGCADLRHHGLEDQAVCVYPAAHYAAWREWLGKSAAAFPYGSLGENFTVAGQSEELVHVGDRYRIGTAEVEVTKPRAPCATLNKVWERSEFAARMGRLDQTGWYLRVLVAGTVAAGQPWELLARDESAPTIAASWQAKRNC